MPRTSAEMNITITCAAPVDTAVIARFNEAMAWETEHRRLHGPTVLAGTRALMERSEFGRYFLAKIDGRAVGQAMVTYEWSDWRNGVIWWLQSVYVSPEYRRRGVFTTILKHIEHAARASEDAVGLRLYVETENEPAMATYKKLNFTPSGHVVYEMDWSGLEGVGSGNIHE